MAIQLNNKNATAMTRTLLALVTLLLVSACSSLPKVSPAQQALNSRQCVVLVHGLWRSGAAMQVIARDLKHYGYLVEVVDYPSTGAAIPELSERYLSAGVEACREAGAAQVHMVSHSMGGILVRQYLQTRRLPVGSRIVMLSPPNQGSELSRYFADNWWYRALVGPAAASLIKESGGIISGLKPIAEPVGIIAAYRDWSLWPEAWLPRPNDGTVSVKNMLLEEMDDFVLINAGHAMMRYQERTHVLIRSFLAEGHFKKDEQESGAMLNALGVSGEWREVPVPVQDI